MIVVALLGAAIYLIGSVTSAYILVRLVKGVDLREDSTRNVGALNSCNQVVL